MWHIYKLIFGKKELLQMWYQLEDIIQLLCYILQPNDNHVSRSKVWEYIQILT